MSLVNVAYAPALTWANPALHSLEEQAAPRGIYEYTGRTEDIGKFHAPTLRNIAAAEASLVSRLAGLLTDVGRTPSSAPDPWSGLLRLEEPDWDVDRDPRDRPTLLRAQGTSETRH